MKFNAVVGNPPYQENIDNRGEQPPLYHFFYDCAMLLSSKVSLITPARFLFNAGKTPAIWNKKMLNDPHFKVVDYFQKSKDVFNNVDIMGGVAIAYWDKNKNFGSIGNFVVGNETKSILSKILSHRQKTFADIIYSNTSYKYSKAFFSDNPGFEDRVSGGSARYLSSSVFDKFPEVFLKDNPKDNNKYIQILGRSDSSRQIRWLNRNYILPPDNFNNFKMFLPGSNGGDKLLGEAIVGKPQVGATETFVSFGKYDTEKEVSNMIKYIYGKFARFLLSTKKVTQGNKKPEIWSNVPVQDFTDKSDIDWSKSIAEIDKQLYKKYGLDKKEIDFIESMIKPME